MSSPPPLDFPSDDLDGIDVDMANGDSNASAEQSIPQAPPRDPLFLASTPSAAGTPARRQHQQLQAYETPVRGVMARRALGLSTPKPKQTPLFADGSSSPLAYPSSSPAKPPRGSRNDDMPQDSDPLDFPSSPVQTPVRNRRGDIHSSISLTPRTSARRVPRPTPRARDRDTNMNSDAPLDIPPSSAPNLSAAPLPSDEPDEIRAIWGTTVNLADTMKSFRDFLKGFKPKYRIAHNREHSAPAGSDRARQRPKPRHLRPLATPEEGEIVLYEHYLRRMRQTGESNLNLDVVNLLAYPPAKKLHTQLLKYPQEVIPAMDQVLKDLMVELADEDQQAGVFGMQGAEGDAELAEIMGKVYKVRPFGINPVNMRELNPTDTDKLISIKGLVIRTTPIIPDMQVAFFRCLACGHTLQVEIDRGRIEEPSRCPRDVCASPASLSLIHNRCSFADRQILRVQETPDAVPDGQTPHTVTGCVYDELVDVCKPGDRVVVSGVFRSVPIRVDPRKRSVRSLFRTYVDVVHVRLDVGPGSSAQRLGLDRSTRPAGGDRIPGVGGPGAGRKLAAGVGDDAELDDEDGNDDENENTLETRLRTLSGRPDIYTLLSRSLAPSIWGMEDVKKGILLQLFGGTNKSLSKGGGGGGPRYRGDINVLLVGDPGVSKSQILGYVNRVAPRGVYTSGKGSSAVGLTAYVTRDPDSKQLVLESGALVLSDGGICCIDEFDKMSDATRSVLHEVMEQQTVSIAKAGIITTLNARTSILAAANPVGSRYNPDLPVTRNIALPPTLISRFDLVYLMLDRVDEEVDGKLARFLVSLYLDDGGEEEGGEENMVASRRRGGNDNEILPMNELAAYIDYARSRIHPIITEEAGAVLVQCYVEMRNLGVSQSGTSSQSQGQGSTGGNPSSDKTITATTRQLESMIRLSEAHARMRWSDFVEVEDVREANRLMREAIKASAMDPRTGKIDMSLLSTSAASATAHLGSSGTDVIDGGDGAGGEGSTRARSDLQKAIINLLDTGALSNVAKVRGIRWSDVLKRLQERSSVRVEGVEFGEAVRALEAEGRVVVVGERERRVIRRVLDE